MCGMVTGEAIEISMSPKFITEDINKSLFSVCTLHIYYVSFSYHSLVF